MKSIALAVLLGACVAPAAAESPPDAAEPDVTVAGWQLARTEHTFDLACIDTSGEYRIVQARTIELAVGGRELGAPLPDPAPARHEVRLIAADADTLTVETVDDPGPCADRGARVTRTTTLNTGLLRAVE